MLAMHAHAARLLCGYAATPTIILLRIASYNLLDVYSLFGWLVADGWCWFVLREEYCWLVAGGWFVGREKYCWLVADKPSEHGDSTYTYSLSDRTPTINMHTGRLSIGSAASQDAAAAI
jgi:hypothetical protein